MHIAGLELKRRFGIDLSDTDLAHSFEGGDTVTEALDRIKEKHDLAENEDFGHPYFRKENPSKPHPEAGTLKKEV